MSIRLCRFIAAAVLICLLTAPSAMAVSGAAAMLVTGASSEKKGSEVVLPENATPEQVKGILAGMSDEQVRRILITELQKETVAPAAVDEPQGVAGAVFKAKDFLQKVRTRLSDLFTGSSSAPRLLPDALRSAFTGKGVHPPGHLLLGLVVISIMWIASGYLVTYLYDKLRVRIEDVAENASVPAKIGRLLARAAFDFMAVTTMTIITLIPYLLIFNEPAKGRPVIFAWLGAMVIVEVVRAVTRMILAPKVPALRFLPMTDETAQYINKWVLRLVWVVALGTITSSLVRMTHGSELVFLLILAITGFIVACAISLLALWNSRRVADSIRRATSEDSLRHQLAGSWHVGVICYAMFFWAFWVVALLVFGQEAMMTGVITLLILPGYLLADWGTQRLVAFAANLADVPLDEAENVEKDGKRSITKFQRFLSVGFRFLVAAATVFILLRSWGIDIWFGRALVSSGIDILLTLVLAYIFWVFISNYIEKKLKEKQGDHDGGHGDGEGGGGPGGDRFSTLLQLVKKFIFAAITVITVLIILSSMGVDIGPLIAGASVFGIAIGFGAQTLVKDIISGIFFLMDDAFRVGDYIIVGSARGQVEAISVRSFKLRHHLGPLYTIPFGSIKEIQNMTRDWAIMKLQYLVPFDTDIQQVKKIIKKINKEIRSVPELNEFMLDDIKSQGVKAMEEYGMRMRVKFMTKPGGQFTLRKLVLAKMRKEFAEAGIEFAKPRVSVHMSRDEELTPEQEAQVAAAASKALDKKEKGEKKEG
ncbi:mechanosensitive ion channel domain-containing protein [Pseudodesulfovibrio sp. zrk46]|uniref:mechanosensitive ion channel domain-containing protein n=1 Tax=Pseudodesulfovibrio sp. zrk46 TaxID=2725288 RepID=UPI00144997E0|nr:mechanosensitive ion channel domain-containing protein [Pseudodesulfovibrio sp. zrk46]QJB56846.1 mechanosensitive ion channel [Pseudodesulfovibrio sp. zrk46]